MRSLILWLLFPALVCAQAASSTAPESTPNADSSIASRKAEQGKKEAPAAAEIGKAITTSGSEVDAMGVSALLEQAQEKVHATSKDAPPYQPIFADNPALRKRIGELSLKSKNAIESLVANQRAVQAQKRAAEAKGDYETMRDGTQAGMSFSGSQTGAFNEMAAAAGLAASKGISDAASEAALAQQYTILSLPSVLTILRSEDFEANRSVFVEGIYTNTFVRDNLWGMLRRHVLPTVAMLALAALVVKFLYHVYALAAKAHKESQIIKQLVLPVFLFIVSALLIMRGHTVFISLRNAGTEIAYDMVQDFNIELGSEFANRSYTEGGDHQGFYRLVGVINDLELQAIYQDDGNVDDSLPAGTKGRIQENINNVIKVGDRAGVFNDFCVLRMMVFDSQLEYARAARNGPVDRVVLQNSVSARANLALFLDKFALLKEPNGKSMADALGDWVSNTGRDVLAAVAQGFAFYKGNLTAVWAQVIMLIAYVCTYVCTVCIDVAFIFLCATIGMRVIAVDSPKEYLEPLRDLGWLLTFTLSSLIARSLGLFYVFKYTFTSNAQFDAALGGPLFTALAAADNAKKGEMVDAMVGDAGMYYMAIYIAAFFLIIGQTLGAFLIARMVFPKSTLHSTANAIYSGGAAVAGTAMAVGGAVVGAALLMSGAGAPAAGAAMNAGKSAGEKMKNTNI